MIGVGVRVNHKLDVIDTIALKIVRNSSSVAGGTCIDKNIAVINLNEYAVALAYVDIAYSEFGVACTGGELVTFGYTAGNTSLGSLCGSCLPVVAECLDSGLRKGNSTADRTLLSVGKTGGGTSSKLTGYFYFGMSESRNCGLCNCENVTGRAFLSIGKTCGCTGSRCAAYGNLSVTESGDRSLRYYNSLTYRTLFTV